MIFIFIFPYQISQDDFNGKEMPRGVQQDASVGKSGEVTDCCWVDVFLNLKKATFNARLTRSESKKFSRYDGRVSDLQLHNRPHTPTGWNFLDLQFKKKKRRRKINFLQVPLITVRCYSHLHGCLGDIDLHQNKLLFSSFFHGTQMSPSTFTKRE